MTGLLAVLPSAGPLGVLLAISLRRENEAAVVNTAGALAVTLLPVSVEFLLGPPVTFTPLLTYWAGVASVLHCLGMLGLYDRINVWDHLTHTVSAALATAVLYGGLLSMGGLTRPDAALATLVVLLGLGVLWEAVELLFRELGERFGIEPVLIHYGWRDTAFDLVFDVVGAVLVLAVDVRLFVSVFETLEKGL